MNFEELAAQLAQRQLTISAAESLTAGNFQTQIAATTNAGKVYPGGFITYSNLAKISLLNIDPAIIDCHGVVSAQTAEAMAQQTQTLLTVDIALGFTGAAGPKGLDGEPAGSVWIGLAHLEQLMSVHYNFTGSPSEIMQQTCEAGINLVSDSLKIEN